MDFNKEVKERKILHKVKKNWVVIGMMSAALTGAGYVVSQTSASLNTVVAHADSFVGATAPSSSVSANISNITGSNNVELYPNQSATYQISLSNNDVWGNYIPQGTKIKLSFNLSGSEKLSDLINYKIYTTNGNYNSFDVTPDGNNIILTTNTNIYAGSRNVNLTLTAAGNVSADMQLPFTSSLIYNGGDSQINQSSLELKAKTGGGDTHPENGEPFQMGAFPFHVRQDSTKPTYPDAPAGYSLQDVKENLISKNGGTANASYAPIKTNAAGLPYFVALSEFNGGNRGFKVDTLILSDGTSDSHIDPSSLRVYAIDGDNYIDITNEPGVNISYDSQSGQYIADVSHSKYTAYTVDFVGYVTYHELTNLMYIHGWIHYHAADGNDVISSQQQQATIKIVPGGNNTNGNWLVAPDKVVYTDASGNYNISDSDLISGVSAYQTTENGFSSIDNSKVTVSDRNNLADSGHVDYNADNPAKYSISYKLNGNDTPVKREVEVINPYKKENKNATLTATVNYIDADTQQEISGVDPVTSTVTYSNEGVTDTRTGSTNWDGTWQVSQGQKDYSFETPEISGYELVNPSDKVVSGTLDVNGNNVVKNVFLKRVSQQGSTSATSQSSTASSSSASSSSTSSAQSSTASSSSTSSAQSSTASSSSTSSAQSSTASSSSTSSAQSSTASSSSTSSAQSSTASSSSASSAQSSIANSSSASSESSSTATSSSTSSASSSSSVPHVDNHGNNNGGHKDSSHHEKHHVDVPKNNNHKSENKKVSTLPQTGDQTNQKAIAVAGLAISLIGLGMAVFGFRRRNK